MGGYAAGGCSWRGTRTGAENEEQLCEVLHARLQLGWGGSVDAVFRVIIVDGFRVD